MVPPLQVAYLEQLCDALSEGGRGWIHIPTHIEASYYSGTLLERLRGVVTDVCTEEYWLGHGGMQMHFTPAAHVSAALRSRGCEVLRMRDVGTMYTGGEEFGFRNAIVTFVKRRRAP
jgi:hypothetical protein